jgi:DNA-binding PadR family transcriptional regulator
MPPGIQGLGEFEQMVLLAILHVDGQSRGEAYGVPIVEEIERRTGRTVSRAAVYVTLRRLEKRGLLTSWMSEPTGERGGKARRCVRVEPAGLDLLRESRRAMARMWDDLDPEAASARGEV